MAIIGELFNAFASIFVTFTPRKRMEMGKKGMGSNIFPEKFGLCKPPSVRMPLLLMQALKDDQYPMVIIHGALMSSTQ